jgi:hypothetical protein
MTTLGRVYAILNTFLNPYGIVLKSSETKKSEERIRDFVQGELGKPVNEINLNDWLHKPREEIIYALSEILKNALPRLLEGQLGFLDTVIRHHNISANEVAKLLYDGGMKTV